jgi:hypothetical protein
VIWTSYDPAGSPVNREGAGVMTCLHHHISDLDIPLVRLVQENPLIQLLNKKRKYLAGFEQDLFKYFRTQASLEKEIRLWQHFYIQTVIRSSTF